MGCSPALRLCKGRGGGLPAHSQRFLHTQDAVAALLAAARERPRGALLAAADNQPVSFATFMDQFARLVGNPLPLHIPGVARPLSRMIIGAEHMEMVRLPSATIPLPRRPRSFAPRFPGYRSGLRDVLDTWSKAG